MNADKHGLMRAKSVFICVHPWLLPLRAGQLRKGLYLTNKRRGVRFVAARNDSLANFVSLFAGQRRIT